MGKPKGERSKNRPSTSSLAASLLPSGASAVGFGGYLGSSRIEPPSLSSEESTSFSDVDGEVSQHLKRLGRKDPTTKLKALASLCLLFKQKSGEELAQIVPQWAFEYKRLLLDYNREVRRATHDAMTSLVTTVRKGLVPHLKSLMGPWWFAQFDPILEVSQAAKRSFEAAFPASERRLDALMLCITDIFLYLDENLKLTPQAMSDKATPMDELEDMHQRAISSSLLAVATLVDILLGMKLQSSDSEAVTTEQKLAPKARMATILSAERMFSVHNFFLEFLKSKSPVIRSSTYSVLTSFTKHIPHAFSEENMKAVSAAILGVFQEKDASCHSSMWDMVLLFSRKFPDSWSHTNIQKTVLSRLWNFLRHGCYGSQQISYPALVVFLESVPPAAVGGEQFILNFFHNMWAGRNPLHSSAADSLVFFKAFKECFLWGLHNGSRYNISGDAVNPLPVKLISNILVTLLWRDYLLLVNLKSNDLSQMSDGSAVGIQLSDERAMETLSASYHMSYVEELGKCIIGILADISNVESSMLTVFSTSFLKDCLEIFYRGECQPKFPEHVERISKFFHLLDQFAWQKGQMWPLHCLAAPLFAKSFKVIKYMNSPHAVKCLYILVEIFGPVTLFSYLHFCNDEQSSINSVDDTNNETKAQFFLQAFKDDVVPWCLRGHIHSCSEKLDLLIASVQDEFFSEQWCSIITYATSPGECSKTDLKTPDVIDQTEVLASLIEKVKGKIYEMKDKSVNSIGFLPEHWQHKLLDSAAVSAALHSPSIISDARFLRAVLGGSHEDDKACFVSEAVVISVFQEILKKIVIFLSTSSFEWSRLSSSLLLSSRSMDLMQIQKSSFSDKLEMAQFAFDVLEGSIFSLKMLSEDSMLLPCILAAMFIIDWECSMLSSISEEHSSKSSKNLIDPDSSLAILGAILDDHSWEQFEAKLIVGRRMQALRHRITRKLLRYLSSSKLSTLKSILVQTVRSAALETNSLTSDEISSLCCDWMLDMLEVICQDQAELQSMLDQLLMEDSSWTLWVAPIFQDERRSATIQVKRVHTGISDARHNQFIAFVEKLSSSLGFSRVIAGFVPHAPGSSVVTLTENVSVFSSSSYPRAWLAAELLCTWKWRGGSALDSFLPSLSKYAKYELLYPEVHVIFSIVNILFDGILVQEDNSLWISFNTWAPSDDEVENIQDTFLRALTSLLLSLFVKDKIWRKHEALELFENVVGRLFTDTTVNRTCLRILPFILSILIEPLLLQRTEYDEASNDVLLAPWKDDSVLKNLVSWLRRALSFPPLGIGSSGEPELEEWIQLIVSCYPLRVTGVPGTIKVEVVRDISHLEKPLLLSLFQRQRRSTDVSASASEMSSAASSSQTLVSFTPSQMVLGKLTALSVGYCWKEFSEDDWHFVLNSLQRWIESSVLLMEDMAEKVDELVTSYTSKSNLELVEKLQLTVLALDPKAINISGTALLVLSLFSQLVELQETDSIEVLQSIKLGRWDQFKDRVMENILRLFFATAVAEAIASSSSEEASSVVSSNRIAYSQFWGQIASFVINSPNHVRNTAVKSMELWGLSKGPISSLYAVLFSSKPIPSLQFAAYRLISSEPLCKLSLLKENIQVGNITASEDSELKNFESSSEDSLSLMDEISVLIHKPAAALLKMDLVSQDRVNVFLAWAILLSYLHSLSPSSSARESLIQYVRESVSSAILDCIFQNIPLKQGLSTIKKKDVELVAEASIAASAAKHVLSSGSVLLSLETFWPVGTEQMASLAGSIYGAMIWLLPSYVSNWFTALRDRALASAIESFTKAWCSPSLISNELSQVRETVIADENFSVSVNKSAYEIVATYKKEETGMDLVIRLPSCYPLRPVDVYCTRSLGISEVKKRKWLLSLTAFIRNQNGAVCEAVRIWKNNLDKEFRGVEECPICYSIIHTSNHSLPQLACKTCKHKFHSACLYKWFSTSHKSTCPLCQTPF